MCQDGICFKFQSDSINTFGTEEVPVMALYFKFQSDSINTYFEMGSGTQSPYFKFQSDSINTGFGDMPHAPAFRL